MREAVCVHLVSLGMMSTRRGGSAVSVMEEYPYICLPPPSLLMLPSQFDATGGRTLPHHRVRFVWGSSASALGEIIPSNHIAHLSLGVWDSLQSHVVSLVDELKHLPLCIAWWQLPALQHELCAEGEQRGRLAPLRYTDMEERVTLMLR